MFLRSIKTKLLILIAIGYVTTALLVYYIVENRLIKIIDENQHAVYTEKLGVIYRLLDDQYKRLEKTQAIETYQEVFKETALADIGQQYYEQSGFVPHIIDAKEVAIMNGRYPSNTSNSEYLRNTEYLNKIVRLKEGELTYEVDGKQIWNICRYFEAWDWIVVYSIPLKDKYAAAYNIRNILMIVMFSITVTVVFFVSLIATKFVHPIIQLTKVTDQIGMGNLEEKAKVYSDDEVGQLANSFNNMTSQLRNVLKNLEIEVKERKFAEEALRESEEILRGTFNSTADAILVIDRHGKVMTSNDRFVEMWNIPNELIARGEDNVLIEFVIGQLEDPDDFVSAIKYLYSSSEERFEEIRLKGGRVLERFTCPLIRENEHVGRVWNFRDISNRKQAEADLERLLKTLETKNKELQSIVYVASHDLRSPLVNIMGFGKELDVSCRKLTELLNSQTIDEDSKKQFDYYLNEDIPLSLGFINNSVEKMGILLGGLRDVSRVGTVGINIIPLNMNKLVADIITCMQYQINKCDAAVTVDQLSECFGDPDQINQVFTNLINNALKYRHPDRRPEIHIDSKSEGDSVIYSVSDNGIGIDPKYHKKIFAIFHQLDPKSKIGGEGLGLTIVQRILDRNNGKIHVESEFGKGSKFFVTLAAVEV